MLKLFKRIYWDINNTSRGKYVEWLFRDLPGFLGEHIRLHLYKKKFKVCGDDLRIFPGVHIFHPDNICLGNHVIIGLNNIIQAGGGLTCGDYVMLGPSVKIWTQNHVYIDREKPILEQGYKYKSVVLGNDVWVGANVFIMPGANIGDKCIVSAGSVVLGKKYPPYTILAGNPAKKIAER